MHAPPKPAYPVISPAQLTEFDAYLFGIPTRYGNFPAQWKVSFVVGIVATDLIPPPSTGLLGRHRSTLATRCLDRQVWRSVRLHGYARRWPRGHHHQLALHACPPRYRLRPSWIQARVCPIRQLVRSSWWCVPPSRPLLRGCAPDGRACLCF